MTHYLKYINLSLVNKPVTVVMSANLLNNTVSIVLARNIEAVKCAKYTLKPSHR